MTRCTGQSVSRQVCWILLGLSLTAFASFSAAQTRAGRAPETRQDLPQTPSSQTNLLQIVDATRVEVAPKLDGTLDDPVWQQTKPITNFLQREPYEGEPPTERTEVRVLYTKHAVYFGIACFDSNPKGIVATELRRDVTQHLDDYFEIVIDSAHDRRNAYVFQVNPLGTQRDALITEEQQSGSDEMATPDGTGCGLQKPASVRTAGQQRSPFRSHLELHEVE